MAIFTVRLSYIVYLGRNSIPRLYSRDNYGDEPRMRSRGVFKLTNGADILSIGAWFSDGHCNRSNANRKRWDTAAFAVLDAISLRYIHAVSVSVFTASSGRKSVQSLQWLRNNLDGRRQRVSIVTDCSQIMRGLPQGSLHARTTILVHCTCSFAPVGLLWLFNPK